MKKGNILIAAGILLSQAAIYGQDSDLLRCGTTEAQQKLLHEHPELAGRIKASQGRLERFTDEFKRDASNRNRQVYTIPVVFHILHDNGIEKISKAQVLDAMRIINEDFSKLNADVSEVVSSFQGIAADCQIQFKLAEKDPNGNCTSGIEWIESQETYIGDDGSKISMWPRNMYMNVYVVKNISISNAAGYTYVPGTVNNQPAKDAIMVLHNYLGSIGTSNYQRSRTLTHEAGHWLNLFHTWGQSNNPGLQSNCNDDDLVNDTPNTIGWQTCNLSGTTCSTLDNVQNYMDYSYCTRMYTQGQATRMQAALNSSIAQRDELWTTTNLQATGTDGNDILCAADFSASDQFLCAGDTVRFYDESYHGVVNWTWTLNGASQASSTQQNPLAYYWSPGRYDVTLVAGNGTQTTSTTKSDYIMVSPSPGYFPPYSEGFEDSQTFDTDWFVINYDNSKTWAHSTDAGHSGSNSAIMKNFNNTEGATDELMSNSMDLSPLSSGTLSFWYAFAKRYLNNSDKMTLYVSTDCGQTWMPRWSQSGNGLATAATTSTNFVPSSNDWQQVNITLLSSQLAENVRFKFTFECDGGNNLYVDDINIDGNWDPVPILVSPPNAEINVADDVTIDWKAVNGVDEYEYQLDEVASFTSNNLQTGTNTYISNNPDNTDTEFNTSNLSWGQMYYWRVRSVTGGNPSAWAGPWHFTVSNDGIGMNEPKANISGFSVYPNPADRDVTVKFDLKKEDFVVLRITDILGKDVLRPVSRTLNAGPHLFNIERKLFPAGIYAITLTADGATKTSKLILK